MSLAQFDMKAFMLNFRKEMKKSFLRKHTQHNHKYIEIYKLGFYSVFYMEGL